MTPTDRELLARCRRGESFAWTTLVERYERLVYSIAIREGLEPEAAADATQHAFAELVKRLDSINEPDRLGSWLASVARRESWRLRNKQRLHGQLDVDDHDAFADDRADFEDQLLRATHVQEAVEQMEEPCRTLIKRMFFDPSEPGYAEIAEMLNRPVGSIGPMRARCLERLRGALIELDKGR